MSTATDAMDTATGQMAAARAAVVSEEQANATALSAAIGQNTQLASDKVGLQGQLAAAQQTIAKLQTAVPAASPVNPISIVTDASNGLKIKGNGLTFTGTVTNGNGQNGIGGAVTNTTINSATSNGNNTAGHDLYSEAGGGKWVASSNLTINDYSATDNIGVALWIDSACNGVKINRGTFKNSMATGPNAGKQADLIRVEISKNVMIDSVTCVCGSGQNTAVHFHSSQLSSMTNSHITGQVAVTADSREPISDITIKGNQIFGSIYDGGANCPNLIIEGNTYTVPKGHAIAYLKGKTQYTIADLVAIGFEKSGMGRVVNT